MKNSNIQLIGFSAVFISGLVFASLFYQNNIMPAELSSHHLEQIPDTAELDNIKINLTHAQQYLNVVLERLPNDKNPVFIKGCIGFPPGNLYKSTACISSSPSEFIFS